MCDGGRVQVFVDLVRRPVSDYLARFGFRSDLVKAMWATTDAFSGLNGGWDTPGTGMNFLVHNMVRRRARAACAVAAREPFGEWMPLLWGALVVPFSPPPVATTPCEFLPQCRVPGSGGTWQVCAGGMGTVTQMLAAAATEAGADIHTLAGVQSIDVQDGTATGVLLKDGTSIKARAVLVNADPFRLRDMAGASSFSPEFNSWLDGLKKDGTTMKARSGVGGGGRARSCGQLPWRSQQGSVAAVMGATCWDSDMCRRQPSVRPTPSHAVSCRSTWRSSRCPSSPAWRGCPTWVSTTPPHTCCPTNMRSWTS